MFEEKDSIALKVSKIRFLTSNGLKTCGGITASRFFLFRDKIDQMIDEIGQMIDLRRITEILYRIIRKERNSR
jgi:hypothetical protein